MAPAAAAISVSPRGSPILPGQPIERTASLGPVTRQPRSAARPRSGRGFHRSGVCIWSGGFGRGRHFAVSPRGSPSLGASLYSSFSLRWRIPPAQRAHLERRLWARPPSRCLTARLAEPSGPAYIVRFRSGGDSTGPARASGTAGLGTAGISLSHRAARRFYREPI